MVSVRVYRSIDVKTTFQDADAWKVSKDGRLDVLQGKELVGTFASWEAVVLDDRAS
jgi:hypothetical protein